MCQVLQLLAKRFYNVTGISYCRRQVFQIKFCKFVLYLDLAFIDILKYMTILLFNIIFCHSMITMGIGSIKCCNL